MQKEELKEELEVLRLQKIAYKIRLLAIQAIYNARSGHPGGALSVADMLSVLYFHKMRVDPQNPRWEGRDRLVLSKGHASAGLYAALALRGFFPVEELMTFRKIGSRLEGHPYITTPGVEVPTGSLAQGLSNAVGIAMAGKMDGAGFRVYAIISDGELEEGATWEASLFAKTHRLSNLTILVDFNGLQLDGKLSIDLAGASMAWRDLGLRVMEIDGHDVKALVRALDEAEQEKEVPTAIFAHTIKGKGVSYMEGNDFYHGNPPESQEKYELAIKELQEKIKQIDMETSRIEGGETP